MPQHEPGNYWMDGPLDVGFGKSKKGTPYIWVTGFITAKMDTNGEYQNTAGREERTIWLYLSDGAAAYTHEKLGRVGFNGDFTVPKLGPEHMKDGVAVYCKHEEYDGKLRDRWDLSGGSGVTHGETSADDTSKANAQWANYQRNANVPAPPSSDDPPTRIDPETGREIPF